MGVGAWLSLLLLVAASAHAGEPAAQSAPSGGANPAKVNGDFTRFYRTAPLLWRADEVPRWDDYSVVCSAKPDKGGGTRFTLAKSPDGRRALVLWTKRRVRSVASGIGTTQDWGFVWDRNGDGAVDYFVFLDGSVPVETPEIADRIPLPDASGGYPAETLPLFLEHTRLAFHHHADDDFDGKSDAIVGSIHDPKRPGWIHRHVVLRSTTFSQTVDEDWMFWEDIGERLGPVPRTAEGRFVPLSGLYSFEQHLVDSSGLLDWVNGWIRKCELPAGTIPRE